MKFGLENETITAMHQVFAQYPQLEEVVLYGSRAKGNYKRGSDIDISLKGNALTFTDLLQIEGELDDLLLPYKIDISLYKHIKDTDVLEHIDNIGKPFFAQRVNG